MLDYVKLQAELESRTRVHPWICRESKYNRVTLASEI
jgi:hypothetical protein